jgi:hypothetical protein
MASIVLDGVEYPLEKPVDFMLNWAIEGTKDGFTSAESLNKISNTLKAVCPSIPEHFFYSSEGYIYPLIDTYQIVDFVAKLVVAVIDKRIAAVEALPSEERSSTEILEKIALLKQAADQIGKQFGDQKIALLLGGIQVSVKGNVHNASSLNESRFREIKQQIEQLNAEMSSFPIN